MTRARENADLPVAMTESGGQVGIGATSVDQLLHLETSTNTRQKIETTNSGSVAGLQLANTAITAEIGLETSSDAGGGAYGNSIGGSSLHILNNNNSGIVMDTSGRVVMPKTPTYSASDSRSLSGSNSHFNSSNFYNHVYVDVGNHMNTSNGNFTCPVGGIYRIYFRATHNNQGCNVRLQKNGSTVNEAYSNAVGGVYSVSSEAVVACAANDTLRIQFSTIDILGGHQHKQVTFQLLS